MKYLLILLVLGFASCTGAEPRMTAPSNKEKFAIEDFAKSVNVNVVVILSGWENLLHLNYTT